MRCSVTLLREAVSASSSSFAFSGCGWLTPYHLGVINALRETGIAFCCFWNGVVRLFFVCIKDI